MGDTTTNQAHAGTTNTKDDNVVDEDYIWIFCFGSNSLKQLSDRVQTPYPDLITRTFPAIAKGWLRGFKAITKSWENKSTATIWFTGNVVDDFVTGIVVKMTKLEVSKLDPYEGYPYKYIRINLKLNVYDRNSNKNNVVETNEDDDDKSSSGYTTTTSTTTTTTTNDDMKDGWYELGPNNCQAYVMHEDKYNEFVDPSEKYKIACCKTIYTHSKLLSARSDDDVDTTDEEKQRNISLTIRNAATKQYISTFQYRITDQDIQEI